MPKKSTTKASAKPSKKDLTDHEINKVFDDLRLPDGQRGLLGTQGVESVGPSLYFPLTVSTPTAPPIDW